MNKLATIALSDDIDNNTDNKSGNLEDVQLWLDLNANSFSSSISDCYSKLPVYIDYTLIPIYLIATKPLTVYSDDDQTNEFFKSNLLKLALTSNESIGLLYKDQEKSYLVFYFDLSVQQVKCLMITFEPIDKLNSIICNNPSLDNLNSNTFIDLSEPVISKTSNTSIFDKVLSKKKQRSNPFLPNARSSSTSLSSSTLTTNEQIHQAINKIVLSGLRIRGLSTNLNHSVNEKLTIKEIYQMTFKSTLFSLRKFNYTFNNSKNYSIKLNDIQDIVEKLLQIFIDIDDLPSTSSTPKLT